MRALWLETEKTERGRRQGDLSSGPQGGRRDPSLPSGLALLSPSRLKANPRSDRPGRHRAGAMPLWRCRDRRSLKKRPCRAGPPRCRARSRWTIRVLPVLGRPLRHGDDELDWRLVQRSGPPRPVNNNSDGAAPEQSGAASVNARRCGRRRTHRERSTTRRSC